MSRSTRVILVSMLACAALVLAVLAMSFLFFRRGTPWLVLRNFSPIILIGLAAALVIGFLIGRFALASAEAEAARREARLRDFVSQTSHELRTPLAVLAASLEVLHQAVPQADGMAQTLFDGMRQEVARLISVAQNILLLARLDVTRRTPDTILAIDNLVAELAAEARLRVAGLRLNLDLTSGVSARADGTELREALRNLIDNAVKHAPGAAIDIQTRSADGTVSIQVHDDGPGMDAEDVELAFERYYRGTAALGKEGAGLGLAIVRQSAERAGGRVTLHSELGKGTSVTLHLPVALALASANGSPLK